ncbi:hypothetical protein ACYFX5_24710 [Bremerella sp. T1]|uniref:hypothetical protein n=1 Tax=Bremerella sp. TYQ1 TaxID=3119568 RepID=UPI001CC902AC|nr:hypothetical protein [Bremerella volcania]UBM36224.1 hypothetical protein LA756_26650 [Bremerella volcania]
MPFPFDLPLTSLTYMLLYLATFVTHHVSMHFVVAGCLTIVGASIWYRADKTKLIANPVIRVLRDWMPFGLSAAITFGVAPLLFVQILVPHNFYTANLLLGWRWMVVIPSLIAAFYLLYVLKSNWFERLTWWQRALVAGLNAGLFVFIGFCWTANHLVSSQPDAWPETFATRQLPLSILQVVSRSGVWLGVAFASMASIVTAQLAYLREGTATDEDLPAVGWIRWMALAGLAVFGVASLGAVALSKPGFAAVSSFSGILWIGLGVVLWATQIVLWLPEAQAISRRWVIPRVLLLSGMLFCASVIRELIRVASIDYMAFLPVHEKAGEVEGFGLFLVTAVIAIGLMLLSAWWVRQSFQLEERSIEDAS